MGLTSSQWHPVRVFVPERTVIPRRPAANLHVLDAKLTVDYVTVGSPAVVSAVKIFTEVRRQRAQDQDYDAFGRHYKANPQSGYVSTDNIAYPNLLCALDYTETPHYGIQREERGITSFTGTRQITPLSGGSASTKAVKAGNYIWTAPGVAQTASGWGKQHVRHVVLDPGICLPVPPNCKDESEIDLYLWYGDSDYWKRQEGDDTVVSHISMAHWKVSWTIDPSVQASTAPTIQYQGQTVVPADPHRAQYGTWTAPEWASGPKWPKYPCKEE